jgi:hypothetical protein
MALTKKPSRRNREGFTYFITPRRGRGGMFTLTFFRQKQTVYDGLSPYGWPIPYGHWLFPYVYGNHVPICGACYVVGMYVSFLLSFTNPNIVISQQVAATITASR